MRTNTSSWPVFASVLPWLLSPLPFGELAVAGVLLVTLLSSIGWGRLLIAGAGFLKGRPLVGWLITPALGLVIQSGLFFIATKVGLIGAQFAWLIFGVGCLAGLACLQSLKQALNKTKAAWSLVALSVLVCSIYYLINLQYVYVPTADGGFSFFGADSTFNLAVSAAIANGAYPWKPIIGIEPLIYHFGSHAIAGYAAAGFDFSVRACLLGLSGTGLLSLLYACLGVGALVVPRSYSATWWGPVAGAFALFFIGSAMEPMRELFRSLVAIAQFPVSDAPDLGFATGSSAHFLYVHSLVWGLLALLAILALSSELSKEDSMVWRRSIFLIVLASLVFPLNVFSGLAASAILALSAIVAKPCDKRRWLFAVVLCIASISMLLFMGVGQAQTASASNNGLYGNSAGRVLALVLERIGSLYWAAAGFGVALMAVGCTFTKYRSIISLQILFLFCSGIVFSTFVHWSYANDRYLFKMAFHMAALASASLLVSLLLSDDKKGRWQIFGKIVHGIWPILVFGSLLVLSTQLCAGVIALAVNGPFPDGAVRILAPCSTLIMGVFLWRCDYESLRIARVFVVILGCLLVVQLSDSLNSFYRWRTELQHRTSASEYFLESAERFGLARLKEVSTVWDLIATNRNLGAGGREENLEVFQTMYTPIAERRFLLEMPYPSATVGTEALRRDNEILFESNDFALVRSVIRKYDIRFLVCTPGTDLAVDTSLLPELEVLADTGSLLIYRVSGRRG